MGEISTRRELILASHSPQIALSHIGILRCMNYYFRNLFLSPTLSMLPKIYFDEKVASLPYFLRAGILPPLLLASIVYVLAVILTMGIIR